MACLHSLVDLIKKNLYFAEGLSVKELTREIHSKMLQDYSKEEVEKFIVSCLTGTKCFYSPDGHLWYLDKRGLPENDEFYNQLFKEQRALRFFGERKKIGRPKKKKKVINLALNLVPDGRFVQLEGGKWGLTEWEVEPSNFRVRHLVIKVLVNNPEGLTIEEITDKMRRWREVERHVVKQLLYKYPYFLMEGHLWSYNAKLRVIYDTLMDKHIKSLRRQKLRFFKEKEKLVKQLENRNLVLKEIKIAKEQAAAALAEQCRLVEDYEHVVQRFAEKDLLLGLRKKELIKCKQEKQKLENKANCILRECRKWVNKARHLEQENDWLTHEAKKYREEKEKLDRSEAQLQKKLVQLKDKYATEKADLIRENINLKHRLERNLSRIKNEEKELQTEIARLNSELKAALQESEERRYSLEAAEEKINNLRNEIRQLKANMKNPLVKFTLKVASLFAR